MAKENAKDAAKKSSCCGGHHEEFDRLKEQMGDMLESAKKKFDQADPKTKKGIIAGVAGAAALIAGLIGYKKIRGKK